MGNDEEAKPKEPQVERLIRPRYLPPVLERGRQRTVSSSPAEEEDDPYGLKASHSANSSMPNFKKKPVTKSLSFDESPTRGLTKIKASRSKRDLENLLNSQEKQHLV